MVKDRRGKQLKVGDCVLWYDPDEDTRDLTRLWGIDKSMEMMKTQSFSSLTNWGVNLRCLGMNLNFIKK